MVFVGREEEGEEEFFPRTKNLIARRRKRVVILAFLAAAVVLETRDLHVYGMLCFIVRGRYVRQQPPLPQEQLYSTLCRYVPL